MVFNQHHIAHISAARNRAFKQVMTEDGLICKALIEHRMYGLHIEQTLAGEGTQAKQVLVQIRRTAAVGVNAALAGKQGVKRRTLFKRRQWRDHARLQDAIATCDAARSLIDMRCIQWMRGNRHQLAQGGGRQAGVAVEREDVASAWR